MTATEEARKMQDYLDITCSSDHEEMMQRVAFLNSYMSRSGEMWAIAKRELRKKKSSQFNETIISIAKAAHLSASVQNAMLESICEEESFLVDWLERINRSCVHQCDNLRTLISYEKEQLRIEKTGY